MSYDVEFSFSFNRSKNDPSVIVSSQQVLGLYNQDNEDGAEMQKVTKKVQEWFMKRADEEGWDEYAFSGNQCILKNTFKN